MASLRDIADCIDAPEEFSVLEHVFGFSQRQVPADPNSSVDTQVSVRDQIELLQDEYYNVNVITVGWDSYSDSNRQNMFNRADYAIYRAHNIYAQEDIGIGRVRFYVVDTGDADGLHSLNSDDDLEQLTEDWTMDNDGIDVFIPFNMSISSGNGNLLGRSAVGGPCDKNGGKELDAAVVGPWGSLSLARTFSHELGHYLGLEHPNGGSVPSRLMTQTGTAISNGGSVRDSVDLTSGEGNTCEDHCSIHEGC